MKIERPYYNTKTDKTVWIISTYEEIEATLADLGPEWVLGAFTKMSFSSGGGRDIYSRADGGWKENLQRIKKAAGKTARMYIP